MYIPENETEKRQIMILKVPVIQYTDVLLVGGTLRAANTALKLRKQGFRVFCITPFSYLGEDLCATLDLFSPKSEDYRELFGTDASLYPMKIKYTLDQKFIDAEIGHLFQTHPIQLVYDRNGTPAGLLVANRSGFQIIAAKAILDATERSLVLRLAGAPFHQFQAGVYPVELNVIGEVAGNTELAIRPCPGTISDGGKEYPMYQVTKQMEFKGNSPADLAEAAVAIRRAAWHPNTAQIADRCQFHLNDGIAEEYHPTPSSPIVCAARSNADEISELLKQCSPGKPERFHANTKTLNCDVVRKDAFFRFRNCETVDFDLNTLPEQEECDVLVVGGGTGGASATISAARAGAKTICTETLDILGGICTAGCIGTYWFGNRVGFTKEMDQGIYQMGDTPNYDPERGQTNTQWKREWLLEQADDAGARLYFETMAIAAVIEGKRVCGAVVAGPCGTGIIRAKAIVDATGNADLAAAAGAETAPLVTDEVAVQGAGLPEISLDVSCANSDYTFICDSDVVDGTRAFTMSHGKFQNAFDGAQILDTRERRRIIGDLVLQPQDFFANRMYDDTINIVMSNFDTHGFILHPMFMLKPTEHQPYYAKVPFRALLPRNLEGVLVTGLGVSAHRDCMPLIRMQPDVQNQGYAAGLACAMSAATDKPLRDINLKNLQQKLIDKEILPSAVLSEHDSIGTIAPDDSHYELAAIFLNESKALPELRKQFSLEPNLHTAHILAFLGDSSGKDLLCKAISSREWDQGWNYTGMGQFGRSLSELDSFLMALSEIGGDAELVLNKLRTLSIDHAFSHIRTISMALMRNPDPRAIPELERLLNTPGATGYAVKTLQDALDSNREERNDTSVRNSQLKELYLAKALKACDPNSAKAAEILNSYLNGMQGYYALYASK